MSELHLTPAQQAAVDDRCGALLVSAAAGSGKTKVLVERLMAMICDPAQPADVDEFLIITYTNAAAQELRGKIAAELGKRLAAQPENRRLQRQLTKLYLAQISTVHAFCASILRTYAHILDIPADFRVTEEQESLVLRQEVFDDTLEETYARIGEDESFREMIDKLGYGRDDRRLADALLPLYDQIRCRVDPEAWMRRCEAAYDLPESARAEDTVWGGFLRGQLDETLAAAETSLQNALELIKSDGVLAEKYTPVFTENLESVRALQAEKSWDGALPRRIESFGRLPIVRGEVDKRLQERVKSARKNALQSIVSAETFYYADSGTAAKELRGTGKTIRGLLSFLRRFDERYAQEKKRRRIFDFSDLEHEAIRLLTDRSTGRPTAAALEIAQKYREILVDEYQDSNAVQERIFEAISRGGQNRFLVGDVKQSIYRFRLAEPELFLQKYDAYAPQSSAKPGEPRKLLLTDNFRSRPEILDAVNDVFSLVMSRRAGDLDYGPDEAMHAGRTFPPTPQKKVELHCIELDVETGEDEASPEKSEYEALFVAARIQKLLQDKTPVADGEGTRPIRPGDIAILMRSPGRAAGYFAAALAKYRIAAVSDRAGSILDSTECEVLSAILEILDNPHRDIPLAAAMASQVFAFSPDELAAPRTINRTGDFYDSLLQYPEKSEKLSSFLSWLSDARVQAQRLSLTELIDSLLEQTGLADVYSAMADGVQRAANLTAYREMAASFEAAGSRTLMDWNRYIRDLKDGGTSVAPRAQTHSNNAVTIMSVHKSKGLEFPVVVLADLSRRMNLQDNAASVLLDPELLIGCNVVDTVNKAYYPSLARMAIAAKKTRETVSEELRVLYVAMTRAQEMLIMTHCSGLLTATLKRWNELVSVPLRPEVSASARCLGDWILMTALTRTEAGELFAAAGENDCSRVSREPWEIRYHSASALRAEGFAQPVKAAPEEPVSEEDALKQINYRYPYLPSSALPSKLTATQLKGRALDYEAAEEAQAPALSEPVVWRRPAFLAQKPLTGREKGNATHLFMQFVRYEACTTEKGVEKELQRLQERRFLTPAQADAVNREWILTLFGSAFGKRILAAKDVHREFKFSILADAGQYFQEGAGEKLLLQGVVDCFWQEGDSIVLVDFKTDRTGEKLAEKTSRYAPQLTAYAEALGRIFGLPVREKYLYFFDAGRETPV
jgi:ATP-dependent helicase/nuclease subunit A